MNYARLMEIARRHKLVGPPVQGQEECIDVNLIGFMDDVVAEVDIECQSAQAKERTECVQICHDRIKHVGRVSDMLRESGNELGAGMALGITWEVAYCAAAIEARGDA